MRMGTGPGGLRKIDLKTGKFDRVIDTPFQVGHVQVNPWVSGEIVYCHETGGDAPQRIWTVQADGTGNRPLFAEEPLDWVTHETVVTRDEVMFNLIGHQKRLRARPTGIAVINLRTNAVDLLGQVNERKATGLDDDTRQPQNAAGADSFGGFWHCNGSADGRWAVGDTFTGNLWLIDRHDGRRILLSTDHKMKPDHAHPTFSTDGKRILIQSGHFTDGTRLQLVVIPVPPALR
jgi:oligogalacturonide lyase